jgi:hypothetical protein
MVHPDLAMLVAPCRDAPGSRAADQPGRRLRGRIEHSLGLLLSLGGRMLSRIWCSPYSL